ncbi:unnamed protein product, partial [marine sediment metagenome]
MAKTKDNAQDNHADSSITEFPDNLLACPGGLQLGTL